MYEKRQSVKCSNIQVGGFVMATTVPALFCNNTLDDDSCDFGFQSRAALLMMVEKVRVCLRVNQVCTFTRL